MLKNLFLRLLNTRQGSIFLALSALTLFVLFLVVYRLTINNLDEQFPSTFDELKTARGADDTFIFLVWNLFLAWLPFLASLQFSRLTNGATPPKKWQLMLFFLLWLAFFPNAPYMVTDLVHLRFRAPVSFWFDIVLLFSGGLTGLLLGVFSLFEIRTTLQRWLTARQSNVFVPAMLVAGGFGVWLGRFQRWNSWDLVTRPHQLLYDLWRLLCRTEELFFALKITFLLAFLMGLMYFMIWAIISKK